MTPEPPLPSSSLSTPATPDVPPTEVVQALLKSVQILTQRLDRLEDQVNPRNLESPPKPVPLPGGLLEECRRRELIADVAIRDARLAREALASESR